MTNSCKKKYKCLKKQQHLFKKYSICVIQEENIEYIRKWRNSQKNVLRQKNLISIDQQKRYFSEIICSSMNSLKPTIILFSLFLNKKLIGYGGLTNIDWFSKKAELSFLIKTERAKNQKLYKQDFSSFIELIKKVAFEDLGFHRIFTETFNIRPKHIEILEDNGFKLEGVLKDHVFINSKHVDSLIHGLLNKNI